SVHPAVLRRRRALGRLGQALRVPRRRPRARRYRSSGVRLTVPRDGARHRPLHRSALVTPTRLRVLVVGAGGVGSAIAVAAQRRDFFDRFVVADLDPARAAAAVDRLPDDSRFGSEGVDASDRAAIAALAREKGANAILNACDPRLNPPIFDAAFEAGCTYLDM